MDELFDNSFHEWLEANGLPIKVREMSTAPQDYEIYSPGPIDLNKLKLAIYRLIARVN